MALTSPADAEAFPSGASITASANVLEPIDDPITDTVTFHTTPTDPAGPTVDTLSTDTISPFSVDLGVLPAGTYAIYATVANNADPVGTATSATRTFTVAAPIPTTTVLAAAGPPTTYGQTVTFTATVSPTPTGGTVQFYDGLDYLGSPVAVDPGTGEATYTTTTLGAGTHEITAEYSGYQVHEPSPVSTPISQEVDKAELTVRALNTLRAPNPANPNPFPHQITGYQNGEVLASSGVTGAPELTTNAVLESPVGNYDIICAVGDLVSSNYSFAFVNATLTVAEMVDTFSVNFYDQYGDGTGVIVFNGGAERAFKLKSGAFDGTFTEMVDATTEGNYVVFKGVTGASFTAQTWGTGPNGFNHLGPAGFQIREAAGGYGTWAATHAPTGNSADDFDGDGVENGVEYVLGGTKDTNDLGKLPKGTATGGNLVFSFQRALASKTADTAVAIGISTDLSTWTPYDVAAAPVVVGPGVPDVVLYETVTLTVPMAPEVRKFVRLQVTTTP